MLRRVRASAQEGQKGVIGNDADKLLAKARGRVSHERTKSDVSDFEPVGATIERKTRWFGRSGEADVLMVGPRVAQDGVGANPNNIGGKNAEGALAIYVNETRNSAHVVNYGRERYQWLANRYDTVVVVEFHPRLNTSEALIFRSGSEVVESYSRGMKY